MLDLLQKTAVHCNSILLSVVGKKCRLPNVWPESCRLFNLNLIGADFSSRTKRHFSSKKRQIFFSRAEFVFQGTRSAGDPSPSHLQLYLTAPPKWRQCAAQWKNLKSCNFFLKKIFQQLNCCKMELYFVLTSKSYLARCHWSSLIALLPVQSLPLALPYR